MELEGWEGPQAEEISALKQQVREFVKHILDERPEYSENLESEIEKEFEKLDSKTIEASVSMIVSYLYLLYLSIIVSPHVIDSRYPDPKSGFSPLEFYTKERPLVSRFDQLSDMTEQALDTIARSYSET